MTVSRILKTERGSVFEINGEIYPPCAYLTYFEERNDYARFSSVGYRLFSANISFAKQPINTKSDFIPFFGGVFDRKGAPDFSVADASIQKILNACPDAYIFPRIHVCMPQWWIEENPKETVPVKNGKMREALYSDQFRESAGEMLCQLIDHLESTSFADRIFGYQISGGNTQEWFHLDLHGGYHENALPYFQTYLKKKRPHTLPVTELPPESAWHTDGEIPDEGLTAYFSFASESVAETVEFLCKTAKERVFGQKIVGTFYGYSLEVNTPWLGTHGLSHLISSSNIDFFSSPNSYAFQRVLGEDWGDMMPADSVRLHGKLLFSENDIRTDRTRFPGDCRKNCDPYGYYKTPLFLGPSTEKESVAAVKKSFARQITAKNGLWWFDMFGHWYDSEGLMKEMKRCREIYAHLSHQSAAETPVEVAVFIDETVYSRLGAKAPSLNCVKDLRNVLSKLGAPYHVYLIEDFQRLSKEWKYKAVFFPIPLDGDALQEALAFCKKNRIPFLRFTQEKFSYRIEEYRRFYRSSGVWCYLESDDVCYLGNGYLAIHASQAGEKTLRFPSKVEIFDLEKKTRLRTKEFKLSMKRWETKLFQML